MSDKSSEMPLEFRHIRDLLCVYQDGPGHFEGVAFREGFDKCWEVLSEREQKLRTENANLRKIIAKELSENDEYGSEFIIATLLRNQIQKLVWVLNKTHTFGLNHYEDCSAYDNYDDEELDCDCGKEKLEKLILKELESHRIKATTYKCSLEDE